MPRLLSAKTRPRTVIEHIMDVIFPKAGLGGIIAMSTIEIEAFGTVAGRWDAEGEGVRKIHHKPLKRLVPEKEMKGNESESAGSRAPRQALSCATRGHSNSERGAFGAPAENSGWKRPSRSPLPRRRLPPDGEAERDRRVRASRRRFRSALGRRLLLSLRQRPEPQRIELDEAGRVVLVVGNRAFLEGDEVRVVERVWAVAADDIDSAFV